MRLASKSLVLSLTPALAAGALLTAAFVGTPGTARAQLLPGYAVLETGHTDIGLASEEGTSIDLHVHNDEGGDFEYAPENVLLYVPDVAGVSRFDRPAGGQWDFLGTPAGSSIWILPQGQNAQLLFLGLSNEELRDNPGSAGLFTGQTSFSLVSVTGPLGGTLPGNFSVWQTDAFSNPVVGFDTADGIGADDVINFAGFSHAHYNWGFTELGVYEVTLRSEAALVGGGSLVDERTFTFGVGTTNAPTGAAVPEPGTLALFGFAALPLAGLVIRRRQRGNG